jgi:superfamily II DNA or RNA helicase
MANSMEIARQEHRLSIDSRSKRQWEFIIKWLPTCRATIEACTGFGKSRIATHIIRLLRRNHPDRKVIVVVPSKALQAQWENGLAAIGLAEYTEVWIINSLIKQRFLSCSLLVLDEIHRYASKTFKKVFDVTSYEFILGLTALLARKDGKHTLLNQRAPIKDKIPLALARRNGWVAEYRHYNLGLEMNREEAEAYEAMENTFNRAMDKFQRDFNLMKKCSYGLEPKFNRLPEAVSYARSLGWDGNRLRVAKENVEYNRSARQGRRRSIWGNDRHEFSPKYLYTWAVIGMRSMRQIREFIEKHSAKLSVGIELIEKLNRRTITFAQSIETAEAVAQHFGNHAVMYHSKITSQLEETYQYKEYKTKKGVDNFVDKYSDDGWHLCEESGNFSARRSIMKPVTPEKLKERAIDRIINDDNTKIIATGKALDEGFDAPNMELGVAFSRTSTELQMTQRVGRIVRTHEFEDGSIKDAIFVDIYIKKTREEYWLKNAQRNHIGIKWVSSIDEILQQEEAHMLRLGAA